MLVAQDVLAAQEHLQLGVGQLLAELLQPLPGVLVEVAETDVKGGAAPALDGVVAGLVDLVQDGLVDVKGQTGGDQRLVGVAAAPSP